MVQQFFQRNILFIAGMIAGAIGGYLYWKYVGCASGQCMITSRPLNSTLYGAVMGGLLLSLFKKENKKK